MSGKAYTQGQKWDDGCDRLCVCDDGKTGHYSCKQRSVWTVYFQFIIKLRMEIGNVSMRQHLFF